MMFESGSWRISSGVGASRDMAKRKRPAFNSLLLIFPSNPSFVINLNSRWAGTKQDGVQVQIR